MHQKQNFSNRKECHFIFLSLLGSELEQFIKWFLFLTFHHAVQADDLAKALVTYQDKYERIKRQFLNFEANYVGGVETDMENESLRNEIKGMD